MMVRPPKEFFSEDSGIWRCLAKTEFEESFAQLEEQILEMQGAEALEEFRAWTKAYERQRKNEEDALDEPLRLLRDIRNKNRNEFGLLMKPIRETHRRVVGQ